MDKNIIDYALNDGPGLGRDHWQAALEDALNEVLNYLDRDDILPDDRKDVMSLRDRLESQLTSV